MAAIGSGGVTFKPSKKISAVGATAVGLRGRANSASSKVVYKPPRMPKTRVPAGTPPQRPGPDPYAALDQATLDQRATDLANAGLLPQQQALQRQQAMAAQQAAAEEAAIQGYSTAAAGYLQGIPGQVGQGYQDAAATVGAVGTGVGGAVGADLAAKQAAGAADAASQGQSGGSSFSGADVGNTVSYLGGVLPSSDIAQRGAAEQGLAAQAVQLPLDAGREQLQARMAQAHADNDQYAQQLIDLAATFPGLKAQALQQLNQYEIDKANYREQVAQNKAANDEQARQDRENRRQFNVSTRQTRNQNRITNKQNARQLHDTEVQNAADRAHVKASDALAAKAEHDQALIAGIKTTQDIRNTDREFAYKYAGLNLRAAEDRARVIKETKQGKTIDSSASKLLGHVVYKDGTEDRSIKVKQTTGTSPAVKAARNRATATSKARVTGFDFATKLRGKPTGVDKNVLTAARATGGKVGQYVADPKFAAIKQGRPGAVFPPAYPGAPATTNKIGRALHAGGGASTYADAQQKVWAEIDGDGLMSRYKYSRQQVLAIVNAALARAGWRR